MHMWCFVAIRDIARVIQTRGTMRAMPELPRKVADDRQQHLTGADTVIVGLARLLGRLIARVDGASLADRQRTVSDLSAKAAAGSDDHLPPCEHLNVRPAGSCLPDPRAAFRAGEAAQGDADGPAGDIGAPLPGPRR